jgi:hypothetical protein
VLAIVLIYFLVPSLIQNENFHVQLSALGVFSTFFNVHVKLFVAILWFLVKKIFFFFPHFSSSLRFFDNVFVVDEA